MVCESDRTTSANITNEAVTVWEMFLFVSLSAETNLEFTNTITINLLVIVTEVEKSKWLSEKNRR